MTQPKYVVGLAISFPSGYETIVAYCHSRIGDTLAHVSVIGTSFQRIACSEYAKGDISKVTDSSL
jgi:hypothetical protein